ncbi:hypothetical protein Tco_1066740 [Tanacetum coccineum]|uniref:Uncharacterized protein n=1 Tax=Tanacetum coccineum TaxID=301880 RepID=A0ABQ5HAU5_9ASTR
MNLPTSTNIFSAIPKEYWNDRSANLTLILVGLGVSGDNFAYKEYDMRLMLAPRSARALHEKALLKLHGMRKLLGLDFSEELIEKSWGKESANESGLKFIPRFDSSFVKFIQSCFCFSKEFMNVFVRIGFDSTIELVSFDESQVVTFNGKFVCGFRNGDCGTGSQSDNTVGSPHGFVIYGIEVLKGNEKVREVIDVEN